MILPECEPWMDDALCAQTDPELFFPVQGGGSADAKRICAECPVAAMCLDYAMRVPSEDDYWGVFGGLTAAERRALRSSHHSAPSRRRAWTEEEDARLTELAHLSNAEIGRLLGRGSSSVLKRRAALKLPRSPYRQREVAA